MDTSKMAVFNPTTIIKPALNSGRFLRRDPQNMTEAVQEFYGTNEAGERIKTGSNPYNLQRFDGTMQKKGPKFNHHKRRWTIIDPEDPTKTRELENNSKVLNHMVEKCRLINDVPNHPEFGKYISKANIFDKYDPFFVNTKNKVTLKVGEVYLPTGEHDYLNKLLILSLMTLKEFQVGNKKSRGRGRGRVRYTILDRATDRREKRRERELDAKAREYLGNLSDEMKLKVAIALGLIRDASLDKGLVDDLVWEYATDRETKTKGGITKQENFVQMIDKGVTHISAHYIFHIGKADGIIRMQNKEYTAFGERLGKTINESVEFLSRDTNDMFERISTAIEAKGLRNFNETSESATIVNNSSSTQTIEMESGADITMEPGSKIEFKDNTEGFSDNIEEPE